LITVIFLPFLFFFLTFFVTTFVTTAGFVTT
jgi:hypothetical protein